MSKPEISIIMSTFNDVRYLNTCIKSIIAQTFTNWNLFIINDASTDETDKLVKEYIKVDKRIKYFLNTEKRGLSVNLNKALKMSNTKYIARIDSDDIWLDKNKLNNQINFLNKNSKYVLVGTMGLAIDKNNRRLYKIKYPELDIKIRRNMLRENCFIHSSVVIRKSALNKIGYYNPSYKYNEDYDLWLRLGKIGKFANISNHSVGLRINIDGVSYLNNYRQLDEARMLIKKFRRSYPNYFQGFVLWNFRKIYPKSLKFNRLKGIKISTIIEKFT